MTGLLNTSFQKGFTSASMSGQFQCDIIMFGMQGTQVEKRLYDKCLSNRKCVSEAIWTDGVFGHMLKECRKQMSGPLTELVESSWNT